MAAQTVEAMGQVANYKSLGSTEAAAGLLASMMLSATASAEDTRSLDVFLKGDIYNTLDVSL